jgi:hypothetical protein
VPCGRIDVQGKTMVPDERRGKLRLCKDTDGLTHLQWGTRAPDMPFAPETDLLVFPQEAEMKFIPKPGVFVIKFPEDPSRNMFFWSQRSVDEAGKEGPTTSSPPTSTPRSTAKRRRSPRDAETLWRGARAPCARRRRRPRARSRGRRRRPR